MWSGGLGYVSLRYSIISVGVFIGSIYQQYYRRVLLNSFHLNGHTLGSTVRITFHAPKIDSYSEGISKLPDNLQDDNIPSSFKAVFS